jgi:hypothetical protein
VTSAARLDEMVAAEDFACGTDRVLASLLRGSRGSGRLGWHSASEGKTHREAIRCIKCYIPERSTY